MKKLLILMVFLLASTKCFAKDIVITIPDQIYDRVVDSFHGADVGEKLLAYIRQTLSDHETFVASVDASNSKKQEIDNIQVGEVKDPDVFVEEKVSEMTKDISNVPSDSINWDDIKK